MHRLLILGLVWSLAQASILPGQTSGLPELVINDSSPPTLARNSLTIQNSGALTVKLNHVTWAVGKDAVITSDGCASMTLAKGNQCTVQFRYLDEQPGVTQWKVNVSLTSNPGTPIDVYAYSSWAYSNLGRFGINLTTVQSPTQLYQTSQAKAIADRLKLGFGTIKFMLFAPNLPPTSDVAAILKEFAGTSKRLILLIDNPYVSLFQKCKTYKNNQSQYQTCVDGEVGTFMANYLHTQGISSNVQSIIINNETGNHYFSYFESCNPSDPKSPNYCKSCQCVSSTQTCICGQYDRIGNQHYLAQFISAFYKIIRQQKEYQHITLGLSFGLGTFPDGQKLKATSYPCDYVALASSKDAPLPKLAIYNKGLNEYAGCQNAKFLPGSAQSGFERVSAAIHQLGTLSSPQKGTIYLSIYPYWMASSKGGLQYQSAQIYKAAVTAFENAGYGPDRFNFAVSELGFPSNFLPSSAGSSSQSISTTTDLGVTNIGATLKSFANIYSTSQTEVAIAFEAFDTWKADGSSDCSSVGAHWGLLASPNLLPNKNNAKASCRQEAALQDCSTGAGCLPVKKGPGGQFVQFPHAIDWSSPAISLRSLGNKSYELSWNPPSDTAIYNVNRQATSPPQYLTYTFQLTLTDIWGNPLKSAQQQSIIALPTSSCSASRCSYQFQLLNPVPAGNSVLAFLNCPTQFCPTASKTTYATMVRLPGGP